MTKLFRMLPLTALAFGLACDVEDETVTRIGEGVVGVGLEVDAADAEEAAFLEDEFGVKLESYACSDAGWNSSWATLENSVLTLVNQKRAAGATCGGVAKPPVAALTMESRLRCAARNHSKDMANNNFFSHTGTGGTTFVQRIEAAGYKPWLALAENIAAGQTTAAAVVNSWMGSTGHCNNIMNGTYKHIGIGYAYNVNATYDHYWTQDFGKN